MNNNDQTYKIVPFPDMKASFFITEEDDSEKILLRIDDGKHKGTIIEISDMTLSEESSSTMSFEMAVLYSPNDVSSSDKSLTSIVKKLIKKILHYAMLHVNETNLTNITK